jgi:hypothetical protein
VLKSILIIRDDDDDDGNSNNSNNHNNIVQVDKTVFDLWLKKGPCLVKLKDLLWLCRIWS